MNYSAAELSKRSGLMDKMQVLGQTASTETALFHHAAAASFGLSITEMKTISVLLQEGSMTAGQIAERLSLTTGAITKVIDRLENRDMVKRTADKDDRRKVIVEVKSRKFESTDNAYESMGVSFEKLLAGHSTEELEFLVRFYEATIELTKLEIAKLAETTGRSSKK